MDSRIYLACKTFPHWCFHSTKIEFSVLWQHWSFIQDPVALLSWGSWTAIVKGCWETMCGVTPQPEGVGFFPWIQADLQVGAPSSFLSENGALFNQRCNRLVSTVTALQADLQETKVWMSLLHPTLLAHNNSKQGNIKTLTSQMMH